MAYKILDKQNQPASYKGKKGILGHDYFSKDAGLVDLDERDMSFTACASTNEIDRMHDVVETSGIDTTDYERARMPLLWAHDYSALPVGRVQRLWKVTSGKVHRLMARVKFADFTQQGKELFQLYSAGMCSGFSIGFIPKKQKARELTKEEEEEQEFTFHTPTYFEKVSLIEISTTPVPANASSLASMRNMAAKGMISPAIMKCIGESCSILDSLPEDWELELEDENISIGNVKDSKVIKDAVSIIARNAVNQELKKRGFSTEREVVHVEGVGRFTKEDFEKTIKEAVNKALHPWLTPNLLDLDDE